MMTSHNHTSDKITLKKLYEAMSTLREMNLPISDELVDKANSLEEEIIKNDILPVLKDAIEPALKDVQREMVLVVDYKPGKPITVSLSRKTNIEKLISAKPILEESYSHVEVKEESLKQTNSAYASQKHTYANADTTMGRFVSYMRKLNHSESTINGYSNALQNHIPKFIAELYNQSYRSTFCYIKKEEVVKIYNRLMESPSFIVINEDMHHEMSAALKKYLNFLEKEY